MALLSLSERMKCYNSCICTTSLRCVLLHVYAGIFLGKIWSRIWKVNHHCGFSNASSNDLKRWILYYNGCICWVYSDYASIYACSDRLCKMRSSHIGCICLASLHCGSLDVSEDYQHGRTSTHTDYIGGAFPHCVCSCVFELMEPTFELMSKCCFLMQISCRSIIVVISATFLRLSMSTRLESYLRWK